MKHCVVGILAVGVSCTLFLGGDGRLSLCPEFSILHT